ncbi:MAG: helix-turn-helix transcriptional regulator [Actinomycetota bacterium]
MTTPETQAEDIARVRALCAGGAARAIRVAARLSLKEVASDVGVSLSTVWRWEMARRSPRGPAALRYLRLLDRLLQGGWHAR